MAVPGRHVPAGHHRGNDGDAHGGAGGERADGGAGSTGRRAAGGPPAATLAGRESALPPSRARHARAFEASRRTTSRGEALVFLQPAPPLADLSGYAIIPWNQVQVLVPNKTEALAILQGMGSDRTHQVDDLAAELAAELTAPAVVVTLGESGCIAHADGSSRRYPAHPAVPVDTTGASDAFVACLAAFMLADVSEADAIEAALAAAAWTIGRPGGHQAMPTLEQLIEMSSQPR